MFERFTGQARAVVVRSQDEARAMGHRVIGTEHLLLGLLDDEHGAAAEVLRGAGLRAEGVRERIQRILGGDDPGLDADALRSIGIDLEVVRDQVERTFGPGALDVPTPVEPRRGFFRRRQGVPTGHIPFSDRAKRVLELSVREASRLRHGYIGSEHILLGLLLEGGGLGAKVLFDAGLDLEELRRRTIDRAA